MPRPQRASVILKSIPGYSLIVVGEGNTVTGSILTDRQARKELFFSVLWAPMKYTKSRQTCTGHFQMKKKKRKVGEGGVITDPAGMRKGEEPGILAIHRLD